MVADFAVAMHLDRFAMVRVFIGLRLMLMAVMAEMRHLGRLMLAIDGRHRPGVLDRQNSQQQDEQELFHPPIVVQINPGSEPSFLHGLNFDPV